MTTKIKSTKANAQSQYAALCTALQALAGADPLILGGTTYKKADVIAVFQSCLGAIAATAAAQTSWKKAVADEKAVISASRPLRASVKSYMESRLGKNNPDLVTFGFAPAKAPATKVKTKAVAQDKSKATREARHTMGSKQRKSVTGATAAAVPKAPADASPLPAPALMPAPAPGAAVTVGPRTP
ncbi:MAG: hypothetical protein ACREJ3_04755 [Polyangiaceae bacterium]